MGLNRRTFLFGSLAAPLAAQRRGVRNAPPERPNILLIVADDLAAWMLGCYGNREIRTPHIDELARGGVRFLNSYVCTPICSASRATLFTGRTPRQHGVECFLTPNPIADPPQGQKEPPPSFRDEVMISDLFAGHGYACGYVGKWHMGDDRTPQHHHDFWYTMLGGSSRYQDPTMSWNGDLVEEKGYLTELMTAKACQFLDQQRTDKPFFLTVSYFNPHTPYTGHPEKYSGMYENTPFNTVGWQPPAENALREKTYLDDIVGNLRLCAASTTALDDQIPVLLRKLSERGMRENTLVLFTSDNGYLLGRHGLWSKGLASHPINMYEEVMQVPMIWNWPGKTPVEATRPELISFYDVLPTLCDVAGVPAPADRKLPGRSYRALAQGRPLPTKDPWPTTVFGVFRNTEMARDPRYKLVRRDGGASPGEFYDLALDPGEQVNQYENPRFLIARQRLAAELAAWRKEYA